MNMWQHRGRPAQEHKPGDPGNPGIYLDAIRCGLTQAAGSLWADHGSNCQTAWVLPGCRAERERGGGGWLGGCVGVEAENEGMADKPSWQGLVGTNAPTSSDWFKSITGTSAPTLSWSSLVGTAAPTRVYTSSPTIDFLSGEWAACKGQGA